MITSEQIRASRALLGWTAQALADASGVGVATIRRYELKNGVPGGTVDRLRRLQVALEQAGIEFTGNPEVNPGVVLHLKPSE